MAFLFFPTTRNATTEMMMCGTQQRKQQDTTGKTVFNSFFSHLVFVFAVQCNCIRYHLDCYYFFPFSFRNHISTCKQQYCLILAVSCHHFAIHLLTMRPVKRKYDLFFPLFLISIELFLCTWDERNFFNCVEEKQNFLHLFVCSM